MREVVLRAMRPDDDDALRTFHDDADAALWNGLPEDVADWRERYAAQDERGATFAVADPDDDRLLGTIAVFDVDLDQRDAELGYRVVPAERGQGVATAALDAAARWAFETYDLRRLELYHAVDNPASCTVAERAGFRQEGVLRESYRYGDGRWYDEHLHARLRTDPPPPPAR
jgi:RimJ/RimL family protein N-acetyltransferase